MNPSTLAAGLRRLRSKLSSQNCRENSDEQLLHTFAVQHDDSAFAVLVRRHGPMVLHVCRRVLEQEQDAEDAFQATFLVLAQNAATLRKKSALASFLHGTAYRLALSAKRAAARRRKHEDQATARSPVNPADDLSWREVRALLDEEIVRLPEKYRSVFILCCLEDVSRTEVGQRLGLKEGTVSSRLAEAKRRLQQRLSQRGVELTAVLATSTLAAQQASALPLVLVSTTIKAAIATVLGQGTAGLVSASVAGLLKSAAATAMRGKLLMLAALAVGVAVATAGVMARREPPQPPAEPPRAEQVAKPPAEKPIDTLKVSGRVLDPDGKPIKGAGLYWPRLPKSEKLSIEDREKAFDGAERVKTDADGRFHFELPRSDIHPEWPIPLVAAADGYGVDGVVLSKDDPSPKVTLRLVKDHPIEGRIISTEGKPLAGVNVRIMLVGKTRQERLDDFLAVWKRKESGGPDHALGQIAVNLFAPRSLKSAQAVTDKDGRFRIQGAGVERLAMVMLRGRGLTPAQLFVANRAGFDPAEWNKAARDNVLPGNRRPDHPLPLYGPKIEYIAPAGRRIEGTVREAGSGKTVPGYRIDHGGEDIEAISDKEGKYKLLDVPKKKEYWLHAHPPADSAWLFTTIVTKDAPALQTIQVDISVARGIVVSGRVLDRATGKGVPAYVRYVPLPGNKFFGKPGYDIRQFLLTTTDLREPGRYQLAVMPGPGVLMAQVRGLSSTANGGENMNLYKQAELDPKDRKYIKFANGGDEDRTFVTAIENQHESLSLVNDAKVIDFAADAGPVKCDLIVDRGATRTIQIEDADGKPLKGTAVAGLTATWPDVLTIKDATCAAVALDPKKPRRLIFFHAKRNLVASQLLRGDEKEPVVVRLGRANPVIGRLLTSDGQPLVGTDIYLNWADAVGNQLYGGPQNRPKVRTGKDGRFRFEGIVPELKFRLGIIRGETIFLGDPPIGDKQIKEGETLDLGDVRVKPAR